MSAPPEPPAERRPITVALEYALVIFVYGFLTAVIATGAPYPPTVSSIYAPLLVALLAGVAAYATGRQIALPSRSP